MKALHCVAFVLVVVGALNWGLIGLGNLMGTDGGWNVVNMLLGSMGTLENLVYLLVGVSGLYLIFTHKRDCRMCGMGGGMM
jgi:uncharacterized protein